MCGIEFHIDGAAKLNAFWALAVLMRGTCRRWSSLEQMILNFSKSKSYNPNDDHDCDGDCDDIN